MSRLPIPTLRSSPEQRIFREYGPDFLLRPVDPGADYRSMAAVLDLCNGARDGVWAENWPSEATAEYTHDRLRTDGCWGAIVTAQPLGLTTAGFVVGMPYKNKDGEEVPGSQDLRLLMVNPLFQRQHLGHLLLDWAANFNRGQGADRLLLWVQTHNGRARGVYEQAGYVDTGGRRDREGVPMMECALNLSELRPSLVDFNDGPSAEGLLPLIARPVLQRLVVPPKDTGGHV